MSRGDRGAYRAAARNGLIASIFLLVGVAEAASEATRENAHAGKPQHDAQAGPQSTTSRMTAQPEPPPCGLKAHPGQSTPECREAIATEKAADYARAATIVGILQLVALVGQIVVLVITIRQSRVATTAAVDSVKASQRSADAAEKAVEGSERVLGHAEIASERQLRAYVFVEAIEAMNVSESDVPKEYRTSAHRLYPEIGPMVSITFKNSGQSPAYNVMVSSSIDVLNVSEESTMHHERESLQYTRMNIAPRTTTSHTSRFHRPLTDAEIDGLRKGTVAIYVKGLVTYVDAFRKDRWTTFAYLYNAACGTVGVSGSMTGLHDGNDADRDRPAS